MKLNFMWLGKAKHSYINPGIELYQKRLKHYVKTDIIHLKDVKVGNVSEQKKKEGIRFNNKIGASDYTICLHERGKELTSIELSKLLTKLQDSGKQNVNFLIGGAYGFSDDILNGCNYQLSLSKMTLPHDLCRVILLEQVYRAFTIMRNEKYHNP